MGLIARTFPKPKTSIMFGFGDLKLQVPGSGCMFYFGGGVHAS